ncbi:MAG: TadE/TadG family protein [Alphaproteobacteria bacterium]|nr:TadE/TadG family protein [Alphaproteobacteria bacterium]
MKLRNAVRRFAVSAGGNVAMSFAIAGIPLLGAAGGAIDYSRYVSARTDLYAAMDAAVLAGTKEYVENGKNSQNAVAVAQKYFNQSLAGGYQFTSQNIQFKVNATGNGIAAYGDVAIATPFLSVVGISSLPLLTKDISEADAAIETPAGGADNLEIAVMLDVTGSMCDDGSGPCTTGAKISAAKTAADNLVDLVLGPGSSTKNARISIVPFSNRVRLEADGQGGALTQAITGLAPKWSGYESVCTSGSGSGGSENAGNWSCSASSVQYFNNWKVMPCATDRYYDATASFDLTDKAPGSNQWLNGHDGSRMTVSGDSSDTKPTQYLGKSATDPAYQWNYNSDGSCADIDSADVMMPLANNATQLKKNIDALSAFGATAGALGTAFTWYTLSPNWASIWPNGSTPGNYSDLKAPGTQGSKKLRKIAILMTDGGYNAYRGWKEQDIPTVSTAAKSLCSNMKTAGLEIYTVGFNLNNLSASEASAATDTLSKCATDAAHYIQANSPQDLISAFNAIGNQLVAANLRLTK